MNQNLSDRFGGISRLYGASGLEVLNNSKVLVVGLGGVGSWIVESLARTAVGHLCLVDFDDICISNTNRQIHTLSDQVGKMKTQALKERIQKINPDIKSTLFDTAFNLETESEIFNQDYDLVVDAIDHAHTKLFLAKACLKNKIPEVVIGSAGGRRDPSQIKIGDLSKAMEDTMLAMLRKDLRRQCGLARTGKMGVPTVYSLEKPLYPIGKDEFTHQKPDSSFKKPLDCATGFGTATHVTGTFGFMGAHLSIKSLLKTVSY